MPKPSVDTGMGLERISAILQGVHNNYDIDLFKNILGALVAIAPTGHDNIVAQRVIADHVRSVCFLIADGVVPSNEGRGYVLRRILRRACRHGAQLGFTDPFLHRLLPALIASMGKAYPHLVESAPMVEKTLIAEETQFHRTLEHGLRMFEQETKKLPPGKSILPGDTVFRLYDTYGFPVDLTADMAHERGLSLDMEGFERALQHQREQSQQAQRFYAEPSTALNLEGAHEFSGYDTTADRTTVQGLFDAKGAAISTVKAGEPAIVVLAKTPFYAESGGQIGDTGVLFSEGVRFLVHNTVKKGDYHLHHGMLEHGTLALQQTVIAQVDEVRREAIARHHSATHLLHAALRKVLGSHVLQKGSLVAPERLRFDFSHPESLSHEELEAIERLVNEQICKNLPVQTVLMEASEAAASGAMALFGEKYGERVRVLSMGDFSKELCGGTHVAATGAVGLFKIVSEAAVASGVRRIEAVAGMAAYDWSLDAQRLSQKFSERLRVPTEQCLPRLEQLLHDIKRYEKDQERSASAQALGQADDLARQARNLGQVRVLVTSIQGIPAKALRDLLDRVKQKIEPSAVLLASLQEDGKAQLVAGVSPSLLDRVSAVELVNRVAEKCGGKGGGRPDMAQAGCQAGPGLDKALAEGLQWLEQQLGRF